MKSFTNVVQGAWIAAAVAAALLSAGCTTDTKKPTDSVAMDSKPAPASAPTESKRAPDTAMTARAIDLTGAQEVPPSTTSASGMAMIMIGSDKSVSGTVKVAGIVPTAAHIHEAPKGSNGPVIVPMTKSSDTTFTIAPGAKLTDAQYASYMAGKLYVNVHSAAYPGGEIRAQLIPK